MLRRQRLPKEKIERVRLIYRTPNRCSHEPGACDHVRTPKISSSPRHYRISSRTHAAQHCVRDEKTQKCNTSLAMLMLTVRDLVSMRSACIMQEPIFQPCSFADSLHSLSESRMRCVICLYWFMPPWIFLNWMPYKLIKGNLTMQISNRRIRYSPVSFCTRVVVAAMS